MTTVIARVLVMKFPYLHLLLRNLTLLCVCLKVTTTGYGDIVPVTDIERIVAVATMLSGVTVLGYIIGTVSQITTNASGAASRRDTIHQHVEHYMKDSKVCFFSF